MPVMFYLINKLKKELLYKYVVFIYRSIFILQLI